MGTRLAIADDVLREAQAVASRDRRPVEQVVSEWARAGMPRQDSAPETRNGFTLLPVRNPNAVVTLEIVNQLRDDEE